MAELNEEQLLLLSNLMYYKASGSGGGNTGTVADICNDIKYGKESELVKQLSGDFDKNIGAIKEVADAILSDPQLSSLRVVESIDKNNVYATCFVDADGSATVAVRGTGGSFDAWKDNVIAAYDTDTKCQETMLEFANDLKEKGFSNITITGHSKGGNMAQYVTIRSDDFVGRCVSFDGQGFNKEFLEEYADKIEKNSGKIKSICAKNDYVNILLNSVAGETVYLENNNSELFGGHSPFTLWKTNKGDLRYGRFAHPVEQDEKMAILDVIADKFCNDLNNANWFVKTQLTDKIGIIVAYFFSESLWEAAKDIAVDMILDSLLNFIPGVALYNAIKYLILRNWLRDEIRSILAYIENGKAEKDIIKKKKKENASHSHHPIDIGVQPELMQVAAQQLDTCADKLSRILSEMDEIHLTGVLFNRIRAQIADVKFYISANTGRILREGKCLTDIARKYEATETSIVDDASQYAV